MLSLWDEIDSAPGFGALPGQFVPGYDRIVQPRHFKPALAPFRPTCYCVEIIPSRYIVPCKARIAPRFPGVEYQRIYSPGC